MQIHVTNEIEMDYGTIIYRGGKNVGNLDKWLGLCGMPGKKGCHEVFETHFTMTDIDPKLSHSLEEPGTRKQNLT